MYCNSCGARLPDDYAYCAFCGKKLNTGDEGAPKRIHVDPYQRQAAEPEQQNYNAAPSWSPEQPAQQSAHSERKTLIIILGLCAFAMFFAVLVFLKNSVGTPSVTVTPQGTTQHSTVKTNTPANGEVLYNKYGDLNVDLTVKNQTAQDCVVRLYGSGTVAQMLYVKANSTAEFDSPVGTYKIQVATGPSWQGADTWFGAATKFYTMDEKGVYSWGTEQTLVIPKNLSGFSLDIDGWDS